MTEAVNQRRGPKHRRRWSGTGSPDIYGAVDLGTNNCRLLVARPAAQGFRVIDAFSRIVRLGEGLMQNGRLSEVAMLRTIDALKICARKMQKRRVTRARAVATEACRQARNCGDFADRVKQQTGIELEIISNSEEAALGFYGCTPLLDSKVPNALIFDIGGGSTEVSWLRIDAGADGRETCELARPELVDCCSVPHGVVSFAERYGGVHVSAEAYAGMVDEVVAILRPFDVQHRLSEKVGCGEIQMLGTSGTVTTLSGIAKKLPRYSRARVDGSYLEFDTAIALSRRIAGMTYDERLAHPCIGTERADLVVAGCAILEGICRTWPVARLRVADRGLREGILFMLMGQAGQSVAAAGARRTGRQA